MERTLLSYPLPSLACAIFTGILLKAAYLILLKIEYIQNGKMIQHSHKYEGIWHLFVMVDIVQNKRKDSFREKDMKLRIGKEVIDEVPTERNHSNHCNGILSTNQKKCSKKQK